MLDMVSRMAIGYSLPVGGPTICLAQDSCVSRIYGVHHITGKNRGTRGAVILEAGDVGSSLEDDYGEPRTRC